jgi:hypothetical protein
MILNPERWSGSPTGHTDMRQGGAGLVLAVQGGFQRARFPSISRELVPMNPPTNYGRRDRNSLRKRGEDVTQALDGRRVSKK